MSEKKDLLNNLKIDRTAPPSEEPMTPLVRYGILGAISVAIVFGWLFFTSEEPVEVTTFTVKEINQNDTSISSILDASGYVTARRQATVSSKITGKVLEILLILFKICLNFSRLSTFDGRCIVKTRYLPKVSLSLLVLNEAESV